MQMKISSPKRLQAVGAFCLIRGTVVKSLGTTSIIACSQLMRYMLHYDINRKQKMHFCQKCTKNHFLKICAEKTITIKMHKTCMCLLKALCIGPDVLTLQQYVEVIKKYEKGNSCWKFVVEGKCGQGWISKIVRNKERIMTKITGGFNHWTKILITSCMLFEELDKRLFDYFCRARNLEIPGINWLALFLQEVTHQIRYTQWGTLFPQPPSKNISAEIHQGYSL